MKKYILYCPKCHKQHIDENEWYTKPHKTHQCQFCTHEWRPYDFYTVGVTKEDYDSSNPVNISYPPEDMIDVKKCGVN